MARRSRLPRARNLIVVRGSAGPRVRGWAGPRVRRPLAYRTRRAKHPVEPVRRRGSGGNLRSVSTRPPHGLHMAQSSSACAVGRDVSNGRYGGRKAAAEGKGPNNQTAAMATARGNDSRSSQSRPSHRGRGRWCSQPDPGHRDRRNPVPNHRTEKESWHSVEISFNP